MTIELPLWMQNVDYSARLDRGFIGRLTGYQDRVFAGCAVTQDGAGSFNVRVGVGDAVIVGDDEPNQGSYFVSVSAQETVPVPATPGAGSRTDTVILRVNDTQAGSGGTPANVGEIEVIQGTTIPATALPLAYLARSAAEPAILTTAITDARPLGEFPYTVGTGSPPATGVEGDLYVQVVT